MFHNLGGDWHPGWRDNPIDCVFALPYLSGQKMKDSDRHENRRHLQNSNALFLTLCMCISMLMHFAK